VDRLTVHVRATTLSACGQGDDVAVRPLPEARQGAGGRAQPAREPGAAPGLGLERRRARLGLGATGGHRRQRRHRTGDRSPSRAPLMCRYAIGKA
jgi:hypothetical protein